MDNNREGLSYDHHNFFWKETFLQTGFYLVKPGKKKIKQVPFTNLPFFVCLAVKRVW